MDGEIELTGASGGGTRATVVVPMTGLQKRNIIAKAEADSLVYTVASSGKYSHE